MLVLWLFAEMPGQVKRCDKKNELWNKILGWQPCQNVVWLHREISTFLRNIKEAIRMDKKVLGRGSLEVNLCCVATVARGHRATFATPNKWIKGSPVLVLGQLEDERQGFSHQVGSALTR